MSVTSSVENRQKMKRRIKAVSTTTASSPIITTTTTKSNRRNHVASKANVQTLNVDLLALMETLIILRYNPQLDPITLLLNPVQRQQHQQRGEPEVKKVCLDSCKEEDSSSSSSSSSNDNNNNNEEEYLKILMRTLADIENAHGQMHFSKEALKFYLATYTNLVRPMDFNNARNMTNSTVLNRNNGGGSGGGGGGKKRPETQLASGAILGEYIRSLDTFLLNLSRATYNDTCALRLMLEHKISLPRRIYTEANLTQPFVDIAYVEIATPPQPPLSSNTENDDNTHVCLSLGNSGQFKRCAVLLTRNIILVYDGQQFSMPSALIEREIGTSLLLALPANKRYIIDMLLSGSGGSGKCRIIDVLEESTTTTTSTTAKNYKERMSTMQELIPNLRHVEQIEDETQPQQENRIYIGPNNKYYFCPMPWPIAVAVGLQNRRVLLAFVDTTPTTTTTTTNEEYLRVRLRCSLINNTLIALLSRNRNAITTTTTTTINNNLGFINLPDGRRMRVIYEQSRQPHEDDDMCILFDEAIPIELRDTNGVPKIGAITHTRQLTKSSDYRPQLANDAAVSSTVVTATTAASSATTTSTTTMTNTSGEMTLSQLTQDMARFVDQFFCLPNYNDIMKLMESRRERFDFKI
nr:GrBNV gp37-like protein [Apis mellifera nudivirus]